MAKSTEIESDQNCMQCGYRLKMKILPDGNKQYRCPYCERHDLASGPHRGLQLGDFILQEKLGSGGMGEVWKASQISMKRDVALKILSPELADDKEFVKRFLREAEMTGRLRHPNIITAYTAGNTGRLYYLATLYIEGIELLDKIKIDGILPEREALNIARIIASALSYAWEHHHLLHCDVKPGNIMIDRYRVPYLMDMGISKIVSDEESPSGSKVLAGSFQYMSPEQAEGNVTLDERTDIYSLGVTLYQMVTANLPFTDKQVQTAIFQGAVYKPAPPIVKNPYISPACSDLINTMMANKRDDRQSNWHYVIADIDAVIAGTYTGKRKLKKWDSIKKPAKTNVNINAPISFVGKKGEKSPETENKDETDTSTRKLSKEPAETDVVESVPAYEPPPVIFDGSKDRRSGLKLTLLMIFFLLVVCAAALYFIMR